MARVLIGLAAGSYLALGGCGTSTGQSPIDAAVTTPSEGGSPGGNGGAAIGGAGGTGGTSDARGGAGGSAPAGTGGNLQLGGSSGGVAGSGGVTTTGGVGSGGRAGSGGVTTTGGVGSGGRAGSGGVTTTGGVGSGGRAGSGGILGAGGEPPPVGSCNDFNPPTNMAWYRCAVPSLECSIGVMSCCGQTVYRYTCVCQNFASASCRDNGPCPTCIDAGIDSSASDGRAGSGG